MNQESTINFFRFSDRKDLTAVIDTNNSISYKDLFELSNQLSKRFAEEGIEKNIYVPLLIEDQIKFIKTVIALWYLGTVPIPINTRLLDEEVDSIIDEYSFKFLITDKPRRSNPCQTNFNIINIYEIKLEHSQTKQFISPGLNNESVVIFTSGSTGRQKGVVHTFSSLINSIESGNKILNQVENDCWLASLPFYHIGGFQIICRSLFYGCSIIIPESFQSNHLAEAIEKFNPTHISLVSTQLNKLIHQKVIPDSAIKVTLVGGGFIDDELILGADKLGWKPFRVYGSSETASMVTAISTKEIKSKPQSVGKFFSSVEIKISDDSEILIKSNSLFKEYLNDKKETLSKLLNGFYYTGDLGNIDDDGYLFIDARRNDLIVTGGENVNPIEVEKALLELPFISEACVFAKQDKTWGQIVAAAIVISNTSIDEKSIKEILKQRMAGYKIPKQFYFTDVLSRTSLGKLEREKIKSMF